MPRKKVRDDIRCPSPKEVDCYVKQWNEEHTLEKYRNQENALNTLFGRIARQNILFDEIFIKVFILDTFYSTNIKYNPGHYAISRHIHDLNIDEQLSHDNEELVNHIAHGISDGKEFNVFSFATKYCSFHRPSNYPIFDVNVKKLLIHF